MNDQMKENIKFALLVVIAATVIYGTFIKEDPIPRRSNTAQASNNRSQAQSPAQNNQQQMQEQLRKQQQQQRQQQKPQGPPTSLKFAQKAHDFGQIKQQTTNEKVFKFTNTGDNPLIIQSAKGSCGCTVPEYPKEPIPPGEEGEIKVVYKPGKQKGRQSKTVTIQANTNPPQTVLNITANVEEVES
jgi:type II secretory pathway pseudopilin PulG